MTKALCVQTPQKSTGWLCLAVSDTNMCTVLKEVKRESAQRHAEGADLRSALREAQGRAGSPQALISLQAELAHLRFWTFLCSAYQTSLQGCKLPYEDLKGFLSQSWTETPAALEPLHQCLRFSRTHL